jgi:hypothetical protein
MLIESPRWASQMRSAHPWFRASSGRAAPSVSAGSTSPSARCISAIVSPSAPFSTIERTACSETGDTTTLPSGDAAAWRCNSARPNASSGRARAFAAVDAGSGRPFAGCASAVASSAVIDQTTNPMMAAARTTAAAMMRRRISTSSSRDSVDE